MEEQDQELIAAIEQMFGTIPEPPEPLEIGGQA